MLTIHHLGVSQSERIIWLLEELNLPYELIRYDRDSETRLAPAEYRSLHPFGTAPVLEDGALRLAESGAVIEYIVQTHASGSLTVAPGLTGYSDYLFWWHFANASLMPAAMGEVAVRRLGGSTDAISRMSGERLERAYAMIEARLLAAPYFAGAPFTIADIAMVFPLTTMRRFAPRDLAAYPAIRSYLARIGTRPAYLRAMGRADPGLEPLLA